MTDGGTTQAHTAREHVGSFFFFPIPFVIFALIFSLRPSRKSDPGSHSRLLSTTVRAMHFFREKISALSSFVDSRRIIVAGKLDAQADTGRGPQRGRFAKTTPGTKAAGPLARRRGGAYQKHTIQQVMSHEGLGGTSIEECASVRRNGVPSAIYCNFGSERNVV